MSISTETALDNLRSLVLWSGGTPGKCQAISLLIGFLLKRNGGWDRFTLGFMRRDEIIRNTDTAAGDKRAFYCMMELGPPGEAVRQSGNHTQVMACMDGLISPQKQHELADKTSLHI